MICLYFGSFNPIHWGHVALGSYAYEKLNCQEVWFILSPLNPQKEAKDQWAYDKRCALAHEALLPYPYAKLEIMERHLPLPLYTWKTIQALKLLYPREEFILLIGSDNLVKLESWKKWERILELVRLYVYPRPGYPIDESLYSHIPYHLCSDAPQHDISSTAIRNRVKEEAL